MLRRKPRCPEPALQPGCQSQVPSKSHFRKAFQGPRVTLPALAALAIAQPLVLRAAIKAVAAAVVAPARGAELRTIL